MKLYSIEKVFEKNLLFLIPFYIFSYEKDFKKIADDEKRLEALRKKYAKIRQKLDSLCGNGKISEYTKQTIIKMTENVVNSLARKYEMIQKGVTDVMGGKILEYEAKDILNHGKMQGQKIGHAIGRTEGIDEKTRVVIFNMLKRNMSDADICALAECSQELVDEVKRTME